MKTSKQLIAEKYTGYEAYCYKCKQQLFGQVPFDCPICGNDELKVHEWKDGNLQGHYAKVEREERVAAW